MNSRNFHTAVWTWTEGRSSFHGKNSKSNFFQKFMRENSRNFHTVDGGKELISRYVLHSVEISEFFYHLHFTWNQSYHFNMLFRRSRFGFLWIFALCKGGKWPKIKIQSPKLAKMAFLELLDSQKLIFFRFLRVEIDQNENLEPIKLRKWLCTGLLNGQNVTFVKFHKVW